MFSLALEEGSHFVLVGLGSDLVVFALALLGFLLLLELRLELGQVPVGLEH